MSLEKRLEKYKPYLSEEDFKNLEYDCELEVQEQIKNISVMAAKYVEEKTQERIDAICKLVDSTINEPGFSWEKIKEQYLGK
jgi:hypothetical protein